MSKRNKLPTGTEFPKPIIKGDDKAVQRIFEQYDDHGYTRITLEDDDTHYDDNYVIKEK